MIEATVTLRLKPGTESERLLALYFRSREVVPLECHGPDLTWFFMPRCRVVSRVVRRDQVLYGVREVEP